MKPKDPGAGLSRKEIESHSSALFNKRINEIYMLVDNAEMDCLNALMPSIQNAMAYYSGLMTLFMETSRMYESDKELNSVLEDTIMNCMKLVKYLKGEKPEQAAVETLIATCLKWRYLMQNGMHSLNYFLRMSFQEPKSISEMNRLFGGLDEIPRSNKQLPNKPK